MELAYDLRLPRGPLATGEASAIIDAELRAAIEAGLQIVRGQVVQRTPVNQGILRQGTQTDITGDGVSLTGRVFNPTSYAQAVEDGRKPGAPPPPPGPIAFWVRRKLGVSNEREASRVAFVIARAIGRRGIKGRHMFRDGIRAAKPAVRALFRAALARIKARLGGR